MTTRNRPFTPKKQKVWATRNSGAVNDAVVPNTVTLNGLEVQADLLSAYKTDLGMNTLQRLTAMRIVGFIALGNGATESVDRNHALTWGIAWLSVLIAGAAANDAQIPDPNSGGHREALWLQRGRLHYRSTNGQLLTVFPRATTSWQRVDITQMRQQKEASDQLLLITKHQSDGGGISEPVLTFQFHTMLALS